ncbi:MAG: glycoside hydrolase 5 family protein [Promethearchaeota archaeon]
MHADTGSTRGGDHPRHLKRATWTLIVACSLLVVAIVVPATEYSAVGTPTPVLSWNGAPFRPVGVNYYPRNHPWTGTWEAFNATELRSDLERVKALGGNCVRTFIQWRLVEPEPWVFNQTIVDLLVEFFEVASEEGVAVILSFFDFGPPGWADAEQDEMYTNQTLVAHQVAQLQLLIPLLRNQKAAFTWDLQNEPKSTRVGVDEFVGWVENLTTTIRGLDDEHLVVVGGGYGNFEDPAPYASLVDAVCPHFYKARTEPQWKREFQRYLGTFTATGKPVILEEFGWPVYGQISEQAQAGFYAATFEMCDDLQIAGVVAWCLWDYSVELWNPQEEHFGLLRVDGSWKPAAHAFHDYATGHRWCTRNFNGWEALY